MKKNRKIFEDAPAAEIQDFGKEMDKYFEDKKKNLEKDIQNKKRISAMLTGSENVDSQRAVNTNVKKMEKELSKVKGFEKEMEGKLDKLNSLNKDKEKGKTEKGEDKESEVVSKLDAKLKSLIKEEIKKIWGLE